MDFNKLTNEQEEALSCLIEEASEIIKAATKILRHGLYSHNPTLPSHEQQANKLSLSREIGNLRAIFELCKKYNLLNSTSEAAGFQDKIDNGNQWLHYCQFGHSV